MRAPNHIYGTAWKKADTARLVRSAICQGFRGFDTACQPKHYDEAGVGAGVAASLNEKLKREDLYLQSKFSPESGQDPMSIPYDPTAPLSVQVAQSCAVSLRNLQTSYLDCLVLHSPLDNPRQTLEVWRAMESLVADAGVRQLGISNCELGELRDLHRTARIKPAVVQNRFYADTGYDREIRAFCRKQGISYQSFWTLPANPKVLAHATIADLASKYARTPAQIFFRYLTQIDVAPLIGTKSETHMREDLAIFEFTLSESECAAVQRIFDAPA
jgi:diketogulonate reductase-like aldo/keto reductase